MLWSSHSCNDGRYSYFMRDICNRYIESFQTVFRTLSQACCAIATTIWRPGLTNSRLQIKTNPAFPLLSSANSDRLFKVIHFSALMSSQSSTWKVTTPIKLDITLNLIGRFHFCKKFLIVHNLRNQTKRLRNSIFVKSNIKLFVEFTNGNLSRKFFEHGTFSFQPRERS